MDAAPIIEPRRLRRVVLVVAALNLAYFVVEVSVALAIGSVSLLADSVDFLEDTAINLLIALALGWPLRAGRVVGHVHGRRHPRARARRGVAGRGQGVRPGAHPT